MTIENAVVNVLAYGYVAVCCALAVADGFDGGAVLMLAFWLVVLFWPAILIGGIVILFVTAAIEIADWWRFRPIKRPVPPAPAESLAHPRPAP